MGNLTPRAGEKPRVGQSQIRGEGTVFQTPRAQRDEPGGKLGGDKGDTSEATIGTSLRCGPLQARQSNFFQRKISQGTTADATIRPIAIG
jgi:hypothetical protein